MNTGTSRQSTGPLAAWRLALVLLALLATSAQQLVVQTHWHALAVQAQSDAQWSALQDGAGRHVDCLWCQAAAHASATAPPATTQLLLAPLSLSWSVTAQLQAAPHPEPAHSWQSRGPPAA